MRSSLLIGSFRSRAVSVSLLCFWPVYQNGKRWWIRLHEKGGKFHEVPAHHNAEAYLDAYIRTANLAEDAKGGSGLGKGRGFGLGVGRGSPSVVSFKKRAYLVRFLLCLLAPSPFLG